MANSSFVAVVKSKVGRLSHHSTPFSPPPSSSQEQQFLAIETAIRKKIVEVNYHIPTYMDDMGLMLLSFCDVYGIVRSYIIDIVYNPVVIGTLLLHVSAGSEAQKSVKLAIKTNLSTLVMQCIQHYTDHPNTKKKSLLATGGHPFSDSQVVNLCKNVFNTIVAPKDSRIDLRKYSGLSTFIKNELSTLFCLLNFKTHVSCYPF